MRKYLRLLLGCLLAWWPMMAVHELGHVVGCLVSGAKVERVILWPWTISSTVRSGSDAPMLDTWAGPFFGVVLPIMAYVWLFVRRRRLRGAMGFFAGFCAIVNGLYIGVGWLDMAGDAGDLRRLGASAAALSLFGAASVFAGLWIWSRTLPDACGFDRVKTDAEPGP